MIQQREFRRMTAQFQHSYTSSSPAVALQEMLTRCPAQATYE